MKIRGFTIIEVVVVFLLMMGVAFLIVPKSLDNTKQARLISKWTEKYSEFEYMFSVIKAQQDSIIKIKIKNAQNNNDRKEILLETIKPYLRINAAAPGDYKQYYMNTGLVEEGGRYYFDNFYTTLSDEVIGLKWFSKDCESDCICAVMSYDANGIKPPNTWGYDVFGVSIRQDKIEPLGYGIDSDVLKSDCSKYGFGIYCSYYYLMGGKFD